MKYTVRGENIKVTPAIREKIEDKLSKFDKYLINKEEVEANVLVKVRGINQIIEVTIPTNKYTLRAEEANEDLYAAIDLVVDKLEMQYRKNKTKLQDRYKKEEAFFKFTDAKPKEQDEHKIIKRKIVEAKPMDEEEAILQMELIDHDFFIFNNYKEDSASVVYKRKDGAYGIITLE